MARGLSAESSRLAVRQPLHVEVESNNLYNSAPAAPRQARTGMVGEEVGRGCGVLGPSSGGKEVVAPGPRGTCHLAKQEFTLNLEKHLISNQRPTTPDPEKVPPLVSSAGSQSQSEENAGRRAAEPCEAPTGARHGPQHLHPRPRGPWQDHSYGLPHRDEWHNIPQDGRENSLSGLKSR